MKKNGIYLRTGSNTIDSGVEKKIQAQISVFSKYYDVKLISINKTNTNIIKKIFTVMPLGYTLREYGRAFEDIELSGTPEFIYIRGVAIDRGYITFLSSLRKAYPKCKILFEVPTYPYDKELLQNKTMWPWYFKDKVYIGQLKKIVDWRRNK